MDQKIETDEVGKFVDAADRLVNDLATKRPPGPAASRQLDRRIAESYGRYERAKEALIGDPMEDEDEDE